MLSLAGTVLLIVCLNISGMMLVRGANRERSCPSARRSARAGDVSSRTCSSKRSCWRLCRGAISAFVLFGIPATIGWWLGVPVPQEIDLDATGVAISSGLCLLVSVLFGLLPAVRFSRPNLIHALKEDAGGGGRQTIRVHRVAALVQIGIAVPFLVISGVMIDRVRTAELGFRHRWTRGGASAGVGRQDKEREAGFSVRKVRDNLQQASGVRAVAMAEGMPVDFDDRVFRVASTTGAKFVTAHVTRIGENFLETIGATLLRGRTITVEDRMMAAPVAVISEPLARQLFPGTEADWRTRDGHAGREPRAGVHDCRRECGLRHVTTDDRAAADPAAAARLVHRSLGEGGGAHADGVSHRARRAGRRTEVEGRPGDRAPRVGR